MPKMKEIQKVAEKLSPEQQFVAAGAIRISTKT